jgi:DNA-binding MarR family transcriptional regulator
MSRHPDTPQSAAPVSDLDTHLGYLLRFVSNHVSHSFQRKVEAAGVTVAEWVILRQMYGRGETSPSDLVERTGLTKGAVSKLLVRLEGKGLVRRTVVTTDRRNHRLSLTPQALSLVPHLARLADRNDEELFGHLPEDMRTNLRATMKALIAHHQLKEVPTA